MTVDDFRQSLTAADPPAELTPALVGLWRDAKGDWNRAHESAQQDEGPEGSWVHAYLHRKEGDQGNAAYWYSHRAPGARLSLEPPRKSVSGRGLEVCRAGSPGFPAFGGGIPLRSEYAGASESAI